MESSFKAVRRPESNRVPCNACTAVWTPDEQSSVFKGCRNFGRILLFTYEYDGEVFDFKILCSVQWIKIE